MESNDNMGNNGERFLFHHLLAMFQTLALQQLGKITNPVTGKVERDLQQARITIDMIAMLQKKTAGNLEEDERKLLDSILIDLQMNYVDENSHPDEGADSDESAEEKDNKEDTQSDNGEVEEKE
ncbi:MAG: DUF1844 domain-containing protein [Candidatus Krumholzibacteria bacterium]|nr:DUF1844 domain-containing protein [Candidatus Krumholzibacteria bacterium]